MKELSLRALILLGLLQPPAIGAENGTTERERKTSKTILVKTLHDIDDQPFLAIQKGALRGEFSSSGIISPRKRLKALVEKTLNQKSKELNLLQFTRSAIDILNPHMRRFELSNINDVSNCILPTKQKQNLGKWGSKYSFIQTQDSVYSARLQAEPGTIRKFKGESYIKHGKLVRGVLAPRISLATATSALNYDTLHEILIIITHEMAHIARHHRFEDILFETIKVEPATRTCNVEFGKKHWSIDDTSYKRALHLRNKIQQQNISLTRSRELEADTIAMLALDDANFFLYAAQTFANYIPSEPEFNNTWHPLPSERFQNILTIWNTWLFHTHKISHAKAIDHIVVQTYSKLQAHLKNVEERTVTLEFLRTWEKSIRASFTSS